MKLFLISCLISIELCTVYYPVNAEEQNENNTGGNEFISLELDSAIAYAVKNNFDLKKTQAQMYLNELSRREKFRNFFPTLSVSYLETVDQRKRGVDSKEHKLSFDSDVSVYDGGKTMLDYEIAKLQIELGKNDYKVAYRQFVRQVSFQYFKVIQLEKAIDINQRTLEQGLQQQNFIHHEKDLGDATNIEVMEIEAKVKEIEMSLKQAKDDFSSALYTLKLLLRIPWNQPVHLLGDISESFVFRDFPRDITVDELIVIALRNRKEVISSDIQYWISKKQNHEKEYYFIPSVVVGLNYSLDDERFFPHKKGWGVSLKMTSPILGNTAKSEMKYSESENHNAQVITNTGSVGVLDNMDYKRNIYESRVSMNEAKSKQYTIREEISTEIIKNVESLKNAWEQIEISKQRVSLYDASLVVERLKAGMGEIRRYDLLQLEIDRGHAAISLNDSMYKYLVAASDLETGVGEEVIFLERTNK